MSQAGGPDTYNTVSLKKARERAQRPFTVPSGSKAIDGLLRGGYRAGELIEVFGESNTGKTQLVMQAAASASGAGLLVSFVDTESTFRPERLAAMAEAMGHSRESVLSRVYSIRAYDSKTQIDSIGLMKSDDRLRECRMIIVDSLTKNFSLDYGGRKRTPFRQGLLNIYLNSLSRDAYINNRVVILTNRVATIAFGQVSSEVGLGGSTVRQLVHNVIHLERVGPAIRASMVRNGSHSEEVICRITDRGFE